MNRLEKLKLALSVNHEHDKRKSNESFRMGFDAASAEYEKIIAELEEALEFYNEREITLTKYEPGHKKETMCFTNVFTEKANKALQKLKEFRGNEKSK